MPIVVQTSGTNDVWTDTVNFGTGFNSVQNADGSVTVTPSMLRLAAVQPVNSSSPGSPGEYWVDATAFYYYQVSGASTGWRKITGATF